MKEITNNDLLMPAVYTSNSRFIAVNINQLDQDIWATTQNIADVFDVTRHNIELHISNIYKDEELDKNRTCKEYLQVQVEGDRRVSRNITHYNLDVILAVGYRVNSKKAGDFRRWATGILRDHVEKGYSLNYTKLENDPESLRALAEEVRDLRSSEKSTYAVLRDCFKICASDYDPKSKEAQRFFIFLQDKFYHAITKMTASKIILDRADSGEPNMGLTTFKGNTPTKKEATTAKNYLESKELRELNLLSEAFLVLAEMLISRGIKMTMSDLQLKIDEVLKLHEFDVFGGYENYLGAKANAKAKKEHDEYMEILKLQLFDLDVPFTLENFYNGEYADLKEDLSKISTQQVNKSFDQIKEKLRLTENYLLLE